MSIVVGYIYKTGWLCCDCARLLGITNAHEHGDATMWGDCGDAEETLSAWARLIGLDRDDEASFDHADFPKRSTEPLATALHADRTCSTCRWNLRQPF